MTESETKTYERQVYKHSAISSYGSVALQEEVFGSEPIPKKPLDII